MNSHDVDRTMNPQAISAALGTQHPALPLPSVPMTVRVATHADMPFIDALQKKHSKALGFFPRMQMEGYINGGHVLVAEAREGEAPAEPGASNANHGSAGASPSQAGASHSRQIGYIVSRDRYLKRDELGVVFQLCVAPGHERQFIAANLLKEVFERSSYGCRLYCCWCAQDLPANRFWEAMGFVPIAYRAGGRGQRSEVRGQGEEVRGRKGPRVHIYWQKRIRANDTTTPYWFPAKTEGGAIREDRIILPIPPGMRWDEALPVLAREAERLPARATPRRESKPAMRPARAGIPLSKFRFGLPSPVPAKPTPARTPRKADPMLIAKARELRDKWVEHVSLNGPDASLAKYDVSRGLAHAVIARLAA